MCGQRTPANTSARPAASPLRVLRHCILGGCILIDTRNTGGHLMPTLTLVRHGQANTSARNEADYDRLSPLGHQQAQWLGAHIAGTGEVFSRVYCGTLQRHRETAAGMGHANPQVDARLNEMEFFSLAQLWQAQQGVPVPVNREEFVDYMPRLLAAWQADAIDNPPETFAQFEARVAAALADIAAGHGPALLVTSGGLIAMALRHVMALDLPSFARATLAIMNTSVHRLHPIGGGLALTQFNAIPHLEHPERQFAQTHL